MNGLLYVASLALTAGVTGFLAYYAWRQRSAPGSRTYAGLALGQCLLALAEFSSVLSPTLVQALFWFRVRYLCLAFVVVFWMLFALEYTNRRHWLSKSLLAVLMVVPVTTQFLLWTNDLHGLWVKQEVGFHQVGPLWVANISARIPAIGFLVHSLYGLTLLAAGAVLLLAGTWGTKRIYRAQALLMASAALIAFVFAVLTAFNLLSTVEFNPFTPGIGISALLVALAVFRFQFLKQAPAADGDWNSQERKLRTRRSFAVSLLIFVVMTIGLAAGGYLFYEQYRHRFRVQAEYQLSSVAELKVKGIANWRNSRLMEASIFYRNTSFSALVQRALEDRGNARAQAELQVWLERYAAPHRFDRVALLDVGGVERMSSPAVPRSVEVRAQELAATPDKREMSLLDFYRRAGDDSVYLAILVPIWSETDNRPLGTLFLRINPYEDLYPFIQSWPSPSASAETLLARREGAEVVFLNKLRHRTNDPLSLRFPLTNTQLPAALAALGQRGVVEGVDYRGEPVFAELSSVPESPWLLVTKVDVAEIFAPEREQLWLILGSLGTLVLAAGLGLISIWQRASARHYRGLAEAAQALRESEDRYRDLVENSQDLIFTHDLDGRLLSVNVASIRLTGYTHEALLHMNLADLLTRGARDSFAAYLAEIRTKGAARGPMRIRTAAGEMRWWEYNNTLRTEGLAAPVVRCTAQDITERKLTEERLRKLSHAVEQSPAATVITDTDGRFEYVNPKFSAVTGYALEELIGKTPAVIKSGLTLPGVYEDLWRTIKSGGVWQGEMQNRKKTGELYWEYEVISPLKNEHGEIVNFIAVKEDITERKRAEEALRQEQLRLLETERELLNAHESLAEADRRESVGRLAAGVAHEVQNPLTIIRLGVDYLSKQLSQQSSQEVLAEVRGAIDRADNVIRDLLDFSRQKPFARRPTDINRVIDNAIHLTRHEARTRNIEIVRNRDDLLPPIFADPDRLVQVFINLLSNAAQAIGRDGSIEVVTRSICVSERDLERPETKRMFRPGEPVITVEIRDNGPGVSVENEKKLFEPFFTTKPVGEGSGLGLAVSRNIIIMHRGSINISARPEGGASALLMFRVAREHLADEEANSGS
ncbi:MAG: PAS domain S-box protein [Betaproteobacteria bacterium]|nr:PAS domain S-box protein [Betaproteobacteria bacterium]